MKKKLLFIGTSILLLITTGMIYVPKFINQGLQGIELTFLSNFGAGLLLLWDGIRSFGKRKHLPQGYHLASSCILLCVLLISVLCIGEANFSGPFLFLHVINPLLVTILTLLYTYQEPLKLHKTMISTLTFATLYLLYVIWYGYRSGDWLYSVINIPESGLLSVLLFYLTAAIGVVILEYIVYRGSRWFHSTKNIS